MNHKRVIIVCSALILLALLWIFCPRHLTSSTDITLQKIYYESSECEGKSIEISAESQKELLEFLSNCRIYQTIYPANMTSDRSTIGRDGFYLYVCAMDNGKYLDVHILNNYSRVLIGKNPFCYYFLNENDVRNRICEILDISL